MMARTLLRLATLLSFIPTATPDPTPCSEIPPPTWPERLVLVQRQIPDNSKSSPATIVTYYDRILGANLIQITPDHHPNGILWDLELTNGTSYYHYPTTRTCKRVKFPVGVLRSDWLSGAESLGESVSWDGSKRVCGWRKADFIDYYADAETMEPVSWYFHTMKSTFNVVYYRQDESPVDMSIFQAPDYCLKVERRRDAQEDGGLSYDSDWEEVIALRKIWWY